MIMQETKDLIAQAVEVELKNALEQTAFADAHHAYAILLEEVEESEYEFECMKDGLESLWEGIVKHKNTKWQTGSLEFIKIYAQKTVSELIQVIAVCEKAEMQVYGKEQTNKEYLDSIFKSGTKRKLKS